MIKIISSILADINVLRPHEAVESVTKIDYAALKAKGINYIVFDKDNTLTIQDSFQYYNEDIKNSVLQAQKTFGEKNIAILSNQSKFTFLLIYS